MELHGLGMLSNEQTIIVKLFQGRDRELTETLSDAEFGLQGGIKKQDLSLSQGVESQINCPQGRGETQF